MGLESTIVCVDNSDYMRNGDYIPTRLQVQQDAVNMVCRTKTRQNPENCVGLVTFAETNVLSSLTNDSGKILTNLHQMKPKGNICFITGIRIAHLALKHRQNKNQKMRIIAFVGSPLTDDEGDMTKLAKRLKKEKVNVDVVNFGEVDFNTDKLEKFVGSLNSKDTQGSHLVSVPSGTPLSTALSTSAIMEGEDGAPDVSGMGGYDDFGFDPNTDPELALALRVSMEEQRAKQEKEAQKATSESAAEAGVPATVQENSEEALLKQALAMSMQMQVEEGGAERPADTATTPTPDFASMTEEQQFEYALQMSMQKEADGATPMETDDAAGDLQPEDQEEEDYTEVISDPAFLQSVLEGLPGVDPTSQDIQNAMGQIAKDTPKKEDKEPKK